MTVEERASLKAKIVNGIEQVKKDIADLKELTKPIKPENSIGRVSRMDAINNKSINEAALRMAKVKLSRMEHALTKIDDPQFGNCSLCKRPINPKRLMLMPQSNRCVRCADKR